MEFREVLFYSVIIIGCIVAVQHMNVVTSGSMEPVLYRGDVILVDFDVSNVQVGNIVVYHATWTSPPKNVVHRVIKKEQKTNGAIIYITKGDNYHTNPDPDPVPVYQDQLISKVMSVNNSPVVIPKIGYITLILRGL
ncbi:MAG: signal peptidase I [Methanobacterium sp.]|nr:signal peptidase I [Methanobacterium sp.]